MTLYKIYFSPTGGTEKVIDCLGEKWQEETIKFDFFDKKNNPANLNLISEDICIIAVPSFGGRVPDIAAKRIQKFQGNGAKAVPVVVFGNRAFDDTLLELKDLLQEAGFQSIAAIAANAEHSLMRQYGAGRPDLVDQKDLATFSQQIKDIIEKKQYPEDLKVPGHYPYKEYNGVPFKPTGNRHCNKCGACIEQCPVDAISPINPKEVDKEKCISCMRCVAICPQNARHVNEKLLAVAAMQKKKLFVERKINEIFF